MYKLLATDIDDTVLALDGSLPAATRDALKRLHEAGVVVVFSSGRADVSIRSVASKIVELADDEYLISFNGARVVTALSGTPLVELPLSPEMVAEVLSYTRPRELVVQAYTGDRFLVEVDGPRPRKYAEDTGMSYDVVPDLAVAVEAAGGTPKLLIIDEHEVLATHLPKLQSLGRGVPGSPNASAGPEDIGPADRGVTSSADLEQLSSATSDVTGAGATAGAAAGWTATFSKPHYLEVVRHGVNKGVALTRLAEHLGISIDETLAVGDSLNDREMIEAAGLGVAVANARQELKTAADVVTERTADEAAIAEVAERWFGAKGA